MEEDTPLGAVVFRGDERMFLIPVPVPSYLIRMKLLSLRQLLFLFISGSGTLIISAQPGLG